jgi:hypothetical protein
MGRQQDVSTADIGIKSAEEGTQSPKDWESPGGKKDQGTGEKFREDPQLSGSGRINRQPQDLQEGSIREDLQLSGSGQVNAESPEKITGAVGIGNLNSPGQSASTPERTRDSGETCQIGKDALQVVLEQGGERDSGTGREEDQLSRVERKLLWLQIKLEKLIPGYTDGATQKKESITCGFYQEENQEQRKSPAAQATKGQQEEPLPVNSGEQFQNHALKCGHTPACTRQITIEEGRKPSPSGQSMSSTDGPPCPINRVERKRGGWKFRTMVSRLSGRGGFRRIVRQGGSSFPKGGTG